MQATVTKPFPGVKDGEVYPREFQAGDLVEGDLARTAVAGGFAEQSGEPADKPARKASKAAPENK